MTLPVIFLTFANDNDNHLPLLDMERKKVTELLIPLESQQHFQLFREPTTTTEDIFRFLSLFKNRVAIFHYGGHAESDKLFLHNEAANAEGIAALLKQQENLQLVFLNGCSTKAQVSLLLEMGIPAVIATAVPINDKKAAEFSIQFYQALAKQHTIKEAFEIGSAYLKTKGTEDAALYRGMVSKADFFKSSTEEKLPWGLYTADDETSALDWKLPNESNREIVVQSESSKYNVKDVPINEKLTEVLLDALSGYSDELEFLQFQATKGKRIDIRKVRRAIMDCLPSPAGEQIRKLFAADPDSHDKNLDTISNIRLEQLVVSYITLIEYITFILLAQLWDESVRLPEFSLKDHREKFRDIFQHKSGDVSSNTLNLIMYMLQISEEYKLQFFVEELKEIPEAFKSDETNKEAHDFMQNLIRIFAEKEVISAEELERSCLLAEIHLGHIFKKFSFCAKYKLTTIKGIDLIKSRHQKASFRHYKVPLDNVTAGYLDMEEIYPDFTDANSVLLQNPDEDSRQFLSLSPFIIDENALKGEKKSKLFFFSHYDKDADTFNYNFVNNRDDKLSISDDNYPAMKEQLTTFFINLFDCKIQEL